MSSREDLVKDKLPTTESEVLLKGNTSHQAVDASIGTRADSATDHAVCMSVIDCVDRIISATQAGTDAFRSTMSGKRWKWRRSFMAQSSAGGTVPSDWFPPTASIL